MVYKSIGANLIHLIFFISFICCGKVPAQFLDDFNHNSFKIDTTAVHDWWFYTGDGSAIMDFVPQHGYATIHVDATKDQRNIWWALIRRQVSEDFDLTKLSDPKIELRIETRIRSSHAPRRVNLHLNTQRTTDFHSHLMEFDIPDTLNWHTISMTTDQFDARPGDRIYGQLALMDWGLEIYRLDIDYFKVDVVDIDSVGPDLGFQVPYRLPVPEINTFTQHVKVSQDVMIDLQYRNMNFNQWTAFDQNEEINILSVNSTQTVILRWDLNRFKNMQVAGSGLLELTTFGLESSADQKKDFGLIRVVEILDGDPDWDQTSITCNTFCAGRLLSNVLNSQMIIDIEVAEEQGKTNLITISNPVLKRLIEGKSHGLALQALGAINASFYAMENGIEKYTPKLYFNIRSDSKAIKRLE